MRKGDQNIPYLEIIIPPTWLVFRKRSPFTVCKPSLCGMFTVIATSQIAFLSPFTAVVLQICVFDTNGDTMFCLDTRNLTKPNTTVKHFSETPRHACPALFFPETYSDFARWDVHEIWHIRNNWNQAKACRAIAWPCSSGPRGADTFRTAIRLRPQEGTLEGNKPLNHGDVELGNAICLWMMAAD